ncbi:hypothetical protein JAAARDRAFT_38943 [Jaapia argillacea MUCL 33604]|uniref:Uncharacterized protein n=1 Tax=Jaapia argillacea MUCL 33604 TaxID=933084 RepID=A0A067PUF8_9AGAM|nr:hypothetical protein JAAARDRAFT_38943 [Jaapia argillacea MUCL 33604]
MRCLTLFLASLLPLVVYCQSPLVVDTPVSITQCQPVLITWSGGISPYVASVWVTDPCPTGSCAIAVTSTTTTSWTWMAVAYSGGKIQFCVSDSSTTNPLTCSSILSVYPSGTPYVALPLSSYHIHPRLTSSQQTLLVYLLTSRASPSPYQL